MSEPVAFPLVIIIVFFVCWLLISFLDLRENSDLMPLGPGYMVTFPKIKIDKVNNQVKNERSPLNRKIIQV